jgi:hypothetical protein
MPIRIFEEELRGSIRPFFAGHVGILQGVQVLLPTIEVIDTQGKVVAPVMGENLVLPLPNNVEFLHGPQPEPGAREGKRRPGKGVQSQDIPVKLATRLNVLDVNGHMIQL